MKKLILIMALNVATLASSAQIAKVALKPAEKSSTPQVVLDSIKRSFPHPISQTLSTITAQNYGRQWDVEISPASEEISPLYYEVKILNKDGQYTAIYDKNGKLMKVKQILRNTPLPEDVNRTLSSKYQGWSLMDKEERIGTTDKKSTTEYKVLLKKGIVKKAVYLDGSGKVKLALPTV